MYFSCLPDKLDMTNYVFIADNERSALNIKHRNSVWKTKFELSLSSQWEAQALQERSKAEMTTRFFMSSKILVEQRDHTGWGSPHSFNNHVYQIAVKETRVIIPALQAFTGLFTHNTCTQEPSSMLPVYFAYLLADGWLNSTL